MGNPLLLEDETLKTDDLENAQRLRRERQALEDEIRSLRQELDDAHRDKERLSRSIANLRSILTPLYRGLRAIFGEIELAVGDAPADGPGAAPASAQNGGDPRWQSFKNSFPGTGAEIIDALLVHGEMRVGNLATLLKRDPRTIGKVAAQLRSAGAISQNAGLLSLKR